MGLKSFTILAPVQFAWRQHICFIAYALVFYYMGEAVAH
jgi:hypothetical protein